MGALVLDVFVSYLVRYLFLSFVQSVVLSLCMSLFSSLFRRVLCFMQWVVYLFLSVFLSL